jgi:hypothetical protein
MKGKGSSIAADADIRSVYPNRVLAGGFPFYPVIQLHCLRLNRAAHVSFSIPDPAGMGVSAFGRS